MVLLTITSVANIGFALLLLALIIWFFAQATIKKILTDNPGAESPASGRLKMINGKKVITFSQGFDMNLQGASNKVINDEFSPSTFAVKPTDFRGFQPIPKMMVNHEPSKHFI